MTATNIFYNFVGFRYSPADGRCVAHPIGTVCDLAEETGGCQEGDLLLVGEGYHCTINKPVVLAHRASHQAGRIYSTLCGFPQA